MALVLLATTTDFSIRPAVVVVGQTIRVLPMLQLVRQTPPQQVVISTISCIQMEHAFLVHLRDISIPAEFVPHRIAMHTHRAAFRQRKLPPVNRGIN
jgi:hypothetical protein